MNNKKLNCWEYKNCGREAGGKNTAAVGECLAFKLPILADKKYNKGYHCGRRCWRVPATLCDDEVQGSYSKKIENCRRCDFYLKVKEEEGDNFVE